MSQTTAPLRQMVPGRLGLAAEPFNPSTVETKVSTADIFFGRMCVRDGSEEERVLHPSAASQEKMGVALATHSMESKEDSLDPHYSPEEAVKLMYKGRVWVCIEADVNVGDEVHFRHTVDASLDKLGCFAPATGTGLEALTNARWVKGGTAAEGIALLELDIL
jgi:hypothetical protein